MTVVAPDLHVLSQDTLKRLAARAELGDDLAELGDAGYLLLAVPVELGGLGGNLIQVCHQQRRLARWSPTLALAVNEHVCWTGTAADLFRSSDPSLLWLLEEAAGGELFSGACLELLTGLAWTYTTLAAITTGIGDDAFDLARSSVARSSVAGSGDARWRQVAADMMIELEAISAHAARVTEDWSAGVDRGSAWPAVLAAARLRAASGARRILESALELCDPASRAAARLHNHSIELAAIEDRLAIADWGTVGDWALGQQSQGIEPQRGQPPA